MRAQLALASRFRSSAAPRWQLIRISRGALQGAERRTTRPTLTNLWVTGVAQATRLAGKSSLERMADAREAPAALKRYLARASQGLVTWMGKGQVAHQLPPHMSGLALWHHLRQKAMRLFGRLEGTADDGGTSVILKSLTMALLATTPTMSQASRYRHLLLSHHRASTSGRRGAEDSIWTEAQCGDFGQPQTLCTNESVRSLLE